MEICGWKLWFWHSKRFYNKCSTLSCCFLKRCEHRIYIHTLFDHLHPMPGGNQELIATRIAHTTKNSRASYLMFFLMSQSLFLAACNEDAGKNWKNDLRILGRGECFPRFGDHMSSHKSRAYSIDVRGFYYTTLFNRSVWIPIHHTIQWDWMFLVSTYLVTVDGRHPAPFSDNIERFSKLNWCQVPKNLHASKAWAEVSSRLHSPNGPAGAACQWTFLNVSGCWGPRICISLMEVGVVSSTSEEGPHVDVLLFSKINMTMLVFFRGFSSYTRLRSKRLLPSN